jgi:hypothetical protein
VTQRARTAASADGERSVKTLKKLSRTIETLWNSFLLPFLGLLVSMNLLTAFTNWSSTDALLAILIFSLWHGIRRIEAELQTIERSLSRAADRHVPDATRLDGVADREASGTLLSSEEILTSVEPRVFGHGHASAGIAGLAPLGPTAART